MKHKLSNLHGQLNQLVASERKGFFVIMFLMDNGCCPVMKVYNILLLYRDVPVLFQLGRGVAGPRDLQPWPLLPQTGCGELQTEGQNWKPVAILWLCVLLCGVCVNIADCSGSECLQETVERSRVWLSRPLSVSATPNLWINIGCAVYTLWSRKLVVLNWPTQIIGGYYSPTSDKEIYCTLLYYGTVYTCSSNKWLQWNLR